MAGVKETRASFEILESKRPLAGDVTISRGDIVAPEVVLINNDFVGPSPIVFEKVINKIFFEIDSSNKILWLYKP